MLRFAGALTGLLLIAGAAMLVLPPSWLAGPVSDKPRAMMGSGFVNDHPDVAPWTWAWSGYLDLRVDDPAGTNIIIWNHGTEAERTAPGCTSLKHAPPPSILALERIGRTRVYYLCTKQGQGEETHIALRRGQEIMALVARFRALGVPPGRIFLAGQSMGGCAALFALGQIPEEVNAGLLFATACFGMGEGIRRARGRLSGAEQRVEARLLEAENLRALMVAFRKDRWNKPAHLGHLSRRYGESVEIVSPACGANHSGAYYGCGLETVATLVETYFRARLEAADAL
ncbi:MAG: hypothetical protein AAFR17_01905 [Pseudomonadota bacterium]